MKKALLLITLIFIYILLSLVVDLNLDMTIMSLSGAPFNISIHFFYTELWHYQNDVYDYSEFFIRWDRIFILFTGTIALIYKFTLKRKLS